SSRLPSFADLNLLPELLKAVAEQGYVEPTPIQAQAIPLVLQGRDVLGGAQTGTGKTAGFALPLLQRLARHANTSASPARHPVRALILTPTRELAAYLVQSRDLRQVLVFTSTRIGANRLAYQLNRDGIHTSAIHGDKSQPERLQALADFKSGKVRVLVATDVAARGLDIEDLPH